VEYALLIYGEESRLLAQEPEAVERHAEATAIFVKEATDRGVLRGGAPLRPTTVSTTVRIRDGKTLTTDGPFLETKEQLGGFFIVDCEDLDEAIELAAKIPAAHFGSIEVRPVWREIGDEVTRLASS
jgi:hypothetical protein